MSDSAWNHPDDSFHLAKTPFTVHQLSAWVKRN